MKKKVFVIGGLIILAGAAGVIIKRIMPTCRLLPVKWPM